MADYSDLAYALGGYGRRTNPYDTRRKYGYDLLKQGTDTSPVQSPWQGVARLAQALAGGVDLGMADYEEKSADKKRSDALAQAMAEPDPQKRIGLLAAYDPDRGAAAAGQLAVEQAKLQQQKVNVGQLADGYGGMRGVPPGGGVAAGGAIAGIESQGRPNGGYGAVGPVANQQGNRAYGKYQVLDSNIAPWTQEVLGKPMTPQEFLANPQAQDKVFEAKFGQYVTQYGSPQAASRAWFAGPGGMNNPNAADVNGMTPQRYEAQFTRNGGAGGPPMPPNAGPQQAQPAPIPNATGVGVPTPIPNAMPGQAQAVPVGGPPMAGPTPVTQGDANTPPPPSPAGMSGPSLVAPQVPQKMTVQTAPPETLAPYVQRLRAGFYGYGPDAATKMEADVQHEFDRKYEADKLGYERGLGDYTAQRNNDLQQPQNTTQNESKMREQFDNLQTVKDYRKSSAIFSNAINAAKTNSAAADLNLVYAFATMMDPGSVVREGEMGMVKATQNASDQVKALVNMVSGGQRISPEARQALVEQMGTRYEALKSQHDQLAQTFGDIADRSKMDRRNVVVPIPGVNWRGGPGGPAGSVPPPPPGFRAVP